MPRTPQEQSLIDVMRQLESNGGTMLDHEPLSDGTQAVGQYAIKPTTAMEMLNREPSQRYPNTDDRFKMQKMLEENPELQEEIVGRISKHLLKKNEGQIDPAAMGYFKGHNRSMERNETDLQDLNLYRDRLDAAKAKNNIMPTLYNKLKEPK